MNKAVLMGRLTRDPDIRYSQGDTPMAVARFNLAVNRRARQDNGQQADFISCIAFGRQGEFIEKYTRKGTKLIIEGRIQTGSYIKSDGTKVYTTDIVVENCEFAESRQSAENRQSESRVAAGDPMDGFMNIPDGIEDEGLPFG